MVVRNNLLGGTNFNEEGLRPSDMNDTFDAVVLKAPTLTDEVVANTTMESGKGYITNGTFELSLPTTASVGDTISILSKTGNYTITQTDVEQQIFYLGITTTKGTNGSLVATELNSSLDLVYLGIFDTTWNVSTASYDNVSFSVAGQDGGPLDLFFKPDGTKMYIAGIGNDRVYQYSLGTAWNLGTASYDNVSFSVAGQEATLYGVFFKSDGTKMYIIGITSDTVFQYSLGTAWNLGTASYDNVSFSITAQEGAPTDLFFKSDGTKMYIVGYGSNRVFQYSLSTSWNVSTASYDNVSFSVVGQESSPHGLFFKSDGTKMYIIGTASDTVFQYSLSTSWNVSTASYDNVSFSVAGQETTARGLFFKSDGTKMYAVGTVSDRVFQYSLGTKTNKAWAVKNITGTHTLN